MFDPWVGKVPWRRAWQPTPVFLPGESHGQRTLEGYNPWGCKELDMLKRLSVEEGHEGGPGGTGLGWDAWNKTGVGKLLRGCLEPALWMSALILLVMLNSCPCFFPLDPGPLSWSQEMGTNSENRAVHMELGCWLRSKGNRSTRPLSSQDLMSGFCAQSPLCVGEEEDRE